MLSDSSNDALLEKSGYGKKCAQSMTKYRTYRLPVTINALLHCDESVLTSIYNATLGVDSTEYSDKYVRLIATAIVVVLHFTFTLSICILLAVFTTLL